MRSSVIGLVLLSMAAPACREERVMPVDAGAGGAAQGLRPPTAAHPPAPALPLSTETARPRHVVVESATTADSWLPRFEVRSRGRALNGAEAMAACRQRGEVLCTGHQWEAASHRYPALRDAVVLVASSAAPGGFVRLGGRPGIDASAPTPGHGHEHACCDPGIVIRTNTKERLWLYRVSRSLADLDRAMSDDLGSGLELVLHEEAELFGRPHDGRSAPRVIEEHLGAPEERWWLTDSCDVVVAPDRDAWAATCNTLVAQGASVRAVKVSSTWTGSPARVRAVTLGPEASSRRRPHDHRPQRPPSN